MSNVIIVIYSASNIKSYQNQYYKVKLVFEKTVLEYWQNRQKSKLSFDKCGVYLAYRICVEYSEND